MHKGFGWLGDAEQRTDYGEMPEEVLLAGKKNIIFLDIDGVIQPYGNEYRFAHDVDKTLDMLRGMYDPKLVDEGDPWDILAAYYDWDEVTMGGLAKLCRHTGSYIVLHSAWVEFNSLDRLKLFFDLYGMGDYILDVCPVFDWNFYATEREKFDYYVDHKAIQIWKWLEKHGQEVGQYIVIDDLDMSWSFGDRFIMTRDRLKEEDYLQAKMMLLGYEIVNHDENTICLRDAYAEFKIETIGARRALFYTLGYSSHEQTDYGWGNRIGDYKVLVNHLMQTYFCESRAPEYEDVDFLCWCIPKGQDSYLRREGQEIESSMSGYHWDSFGIGAHQMLVLKAAGKERLGEKNGEIETARRIGLEMIENRKEF